MATRITPLPVPVPQSSDPENFDQRADQFLTALPAFADEANAVADEMDEAVDTAQAAATASLSNASFVGRWEDQSGSAAPPYSVFHGGLFWSLLEPIADVASSEPDPYNTQWAVTGAPAWYNNFAVGDYLDTARSPGAGWLRRNGAAYPISTYPELAPMMSTIPASFSFTPVDLGITEHIQNILEYDGKIVLWPDVSQHIYVSDDDGETFTPVQVLSGARSMGNGCVFQGKLLIGLDNGQYLQCDDLSTFSVKTITGGTNQLMHLAASATAVVACGERPTTPSGTQVLARSTNLTSWTAVTPSGAGHPPYRGITYVSGMFATLDKRSNGIKAYSTNDGVSFTRVEGAGVGQSPRNFGNASYNVVMADGLTYGLGSWVQQGAPATIIRPVLLEIDPSNGSLIADLGVSTFPDGVAMQEMVYVEDKFVIFGVTNLGAAGYAAYAPEIGSWTTFSLPVGHNVVRALVRGDWVVTVGGNGSVMRGRFINSDAFRVPDDNPSTGWIKAVSDSAGTVGYAGVPEAPLDGEDYVRNGGAWKRLDGGGGGGMDYPDAGIPVSTGTAWGTSKAAPAGAVVGTTDTQTLTNKTLGASTKESVTTGSALTINDASAPFQKITLTGNVTATINLSEGVSRSVWVNPGSYTVTWPAGTVWAGGSAPSLPASKWSLITLTGMPSNTAGMAALVGSQQ